ncbi:peroxiredoxin-like family protein [Cellulophaga sp. HaHa_2_1]|uniref:peroxiredoxin-like family protein n=1 Tax=Cellulophaga sp. HaHa_2_1 TaxID=2749994 RepID=UPI001C4F4934|nr:peroxiredoxin-like family protein [Cellulophaga sp. HaHa_2_1]QXP54135.1 AhpC/TSA family protein [Cellulophaga sp. HaHa_2_1]
MKKLREQTDAKIAAGRKNNPEFMKGVDAIIKKEKEFQQGKNALKIGAKAPNFELPNPEGKTISLTTLLDKGPVVVTFYRGSWCPYCNLQLRALQASLADIHALGATLVAISPEVPDESMSTNEINSLGFSVLTDQDATVASHYGVAWEVPAFLIEHMEVDRKLDLKKINNGNGSILPIPATFVVGTDGLVQWSYVDVDYRTRAEPEEILEALKKLS